MLASFFGDPYIRLTQKTGMDRSAVIWMYADPGDALQFEPR